MYELELKEEETSLFRTTYHDPPIPPTPTNAQPGSPAKLQVLIERAYNGYHLWHPDDLVHPTPVSYKGKLVGELRQLHCVI